MINQKEYLKKYLSSGKEKKKVKKKKSNLGSKTVKIIDDDVDLTNMRAIEDGEFDILNNTEDGPQIVGIVDERGPVDFSDKKRWKIITDDGFGDISVTSIARNENILCESSSVKKSAASKSIKNPSGSQDSDCSLPRRFGKNSDSYEPLKKKSASKKCQRSASSPIQSSVQSHSGSQDSDFSPPRRPRKYSESDKPRRKKTSKKHHRSDSSPVHNRSRSQDSDLSPPRKSKKNSDSDLSPPRNSKAKGREKEHKSRDEYSSNPRRKDESKYKKHRENSSRDTQRRNYDDKHSRTRSSRSPSNSSRSRGRNDTQRAGKYEGGNNLAEYDRSHQRSREDRDKLIRRRERNGSDSPQNRRKSDSERKETNTYPRKSGNNSDSDLNPPRENRKKSSNSDQESSPPRKSASRNYQQMTTENSGFGQAPVFRDRKTGRRRDFAAEAREQEKKDEKQRELEEKYAQWGRGLKQVEDHQEKLDRDLYEMSKPLARYADDADLERELKAQERDGDPMLAYMKRKKVKEGKQEPEKPKYSGPSVPNRFGIRPGYRWDGVDRSNGYEKKWFEAQNARKAVQEEAYKWSTADM